MSWGQLMGKHGQESFEQSSEGSGEFLSQCGNSGLPEEHL